jgi:uncharacterized membrane protein
VVDDERFVAAVDRVAVFELVSASEPPNGSASLTLSSSPSTIRCEIYAAITAMTHSHNLDEVTDPGERASGAHRPTGRGRASIALAVLLLPILAATVAGLVLLWPSVATPKSSLDFAAGGVSFPDAKVTALTAAPCGKGDPAAENPTPLPPAGKAQICGAAAVTVTEGSDAGHAVRVTVPPVVVEAGVGAGVILMKMPKSTGSPVTYSFYDVQRGLPLVAMAVIFTLVTIAVARLRGLFALLGLGFAAVVVVGFVLPALVAGQSPVLVGLTGSAAIMFVVLYLAHGLSLRTTTALLGTFAGLGLTALIGGVAVRAAHLTGVSSDDISLLQQVAGQIDPRGLLTCGIILAGLGVLNDVTITQASAVWELREAAPGMAPRRLYRTAMRIGRDHIASTIYTIVFAYAGVALPVLLLIAMYGQPLGSVLTSPDIGEELVRTMASAIALVLAVPLTTALAVAVATVDRQPSAPRRSNAEVEATT